MSIPDHLGLQAQELLVNMFFQFGGYCDNFHTTDSIAFYGAYYQQ